MVNCKTERDYSYLFSIKQKNDRAKLEVPGVESQVAAVTAV